ncbi:MAG: CBS domain-containing protein, partial [Bdellovibrio sp.]
GMISERDLLKAPSSSTLVEDVMSKPLRTFDIETPLRAVVQAMISEKISAYLITKKEEVVGIVTSEDLLHLLDQLLNDQNEEAGWSLGDFLVNPALQRAAYIVGQTGI